MGIACAQCGAPLAEGKRFCGNCGRTADVPPSESIALQGKGEPRPAATAIQSPASAPATPPMGVPRVASSTPPDAPARSGGGGIKGTMIGLSAADAIAAHVAKREAETLQRASQSREAAAARGGALRTMLGIVAAPALAASSAAQTAAAGGGSGQPATAPEVVATRARTMLGMAVPREVAQVVGAFKATHVHSSSAPGEVPPPPIPSGGTMLGVAMPGIAPTRPGARSPDSSTALPPPPVSGPAVGAANALGVGGRSKIGHTSVAQTPVLPAPPPFVDDVSVPRAPVRRTRGGVPIAVVVAITAGLVLVGGAVIVFLKPASKPISAQPRLDAQGHEMLHLTCDDCADGTTVTLGGSPAPTTVTFKAKEVDLPLSTPLSVGDNDLTLKVDRPGSGRDEEVKLVVPLGFYIRPDLEGIGAKPPVIAVRVAAAPGSDVKVDGKPLALDATGKGSYAVDVSADTEGATDDVRAIDRKIPYEVILKGEKAPQTGVVTARIGVVPLRVDAPSAHRVIDTPSFAVAGQTVAGGAVTIDGQAAPTQPDGSFADARTAPPVGKESLLEVRATAQGRAPRTVHVTVKRVASLDAEAKAIEAGPLTTYDQIAPDIAAKVGAHAVIAGEVVESRVTGHQTIALVNDTRGCASGPCFARVLGAEDAKMTRGAQVRAYGTVTGAVTTASGKTVPELAADFVVRGAR